MINNITPIKKKTESLGFNFFIYLSKLKNTMQFHSKAQEQALMRLLVQHQIAVAGIKNNAQLTEDEKQKALKAEVNNFNKKKKGLQGAAF